MSGPFENDFITADDHWDYPSTAEDRASTLPDKVCKYCGKEGLEWINTTQGWRLGSWGGGIHKCPKKPLPSTKSKPMVSSKVYDLMSDALEGLHFSVSKSQEYRKLMKYFKNNGLTVDQVINQN